MIRSRGGALATVIVLLVGAACGGQPASHPGPGVSPTVRVTTAATPAPSPAVTCPAQVLRSMSEEQRVGQLITLGLAGDQLGQQEMDAIHSHHIGSVWFTATSLAGVDAIRAITSKVQAQASGGSTANVRFLIAANQEGGEIQALQGPGFSPMPSALDQGRMDAGALEQAAEGWGRQLKAAGVNMDFAPVLDVVPPGTDAQNQPIGALRREYGHDPGTAGSRGSAFLRGLATAGVAATAKHFPGLGRVRGNTDFASDVVDTVTTSDDPFLQSFQTGIDAGPPFLMVALATYTRIDPNRLAAFSPAIMQQLLRSKMGFRGVIVSDDLGATAAVAALPPAARAIDFLSAGGDLIVSKTTDATLQMVSAMLARAATDPLFRSRVDDAALRVLEAKQALDLLPCSPATR